MDYKLNSTDKYHKEVLNTLGWELTICNSLYPEDTVLRKILIKNESFGKLLYTYLNKFIPMDRIDNVIEIGGGYGYLMKDFFEINSSLKTTMVDISPYLLKKQKETLMNYKVHFIENDFLFVDDAILAGHDLAIMNENLGDFTTIVNLKKEVLKLPAENINDPIIKKVIMIFQKYELDLPKNNVFNFNLGALEATEKLCKAGIPYIYLGEHSCESRPPMHLKTLMKFEASDNPERISLMGHDEYTIKFSYLERIGKFYGYKIKRGVFADFIPFKLDQKIMYILNTNGMYSDEEETICHFIQDIYKYEFLIFIKNDMQKESF